MSLVRGSFLLLVVSVFSSACKSDTLILTPPIDPGDDVSFVTDVLPILQATCSGSGCHIGQTTNGVNLSNYNSVIGSTAISYNTSAVIPSDADGSPLIDKLGTAPQFGSRMPVGKPSLSALDTATIRQWIDDGALNN